MGNVSNHIDYRNVNTAFVPSLASLTDSRRSDLACCDRCHTYGIGLPRWMALKQSVGNRSSIHLYVFDYLCSQSKYASLTMPRG